MLKDVENHFIMTTVWPRYLQTYQRWCGMLARHHGPAALGQAKAMFTPYLTGGKKIITASWAHPGKNWTGTALQPLFLTLNDETWAAQFMGLIVCDTVLDHVQVTGEDWLTMHCEREPGALISGRTYWKA